MTNSAFGRRNCEVLSHLRCPVGRSPGARLRPLGHLSRATDLADVHREITAFCLYSVVPFSACPARSFIRQPGRSDAGYRLRTRRRPNSNEISCPTGVTHRFWSSVRYTPATPPSAFLCSRACSSDQKKTDLRQKSSMMLGAFSLVKSTIGTKNIGLLSGSWRV